MLTACWRARAQLGAAVQGVVDGVLDMGYRITAHAGGHVFRGCLFANVSPDCLPGRSSRLVTDETTF